MAATRCCSGASLPGASDGGRLPHARLAGRQFALEGRWLAQPGQARVAMAAGAGRDQAAVVAGIGIVHQELNLIPGLTVAENIWLGREPRTAAGLIDYARLHADTAAILKSLGHEFKERASYEGSYQGDGETIMVDLKTRLRLGAADPRKGDSKAVGY